jgi:hypothetical protein
MCIVKRGLFIEGIHWLVAAIIAALFPFNLGQTVALAGPPFVTDDPEIVEYRHWEIYVASQHEKDKDGWSGTAPHFEVNYGSCPIYSFI